MSEWNAEVADWYAQNYGDYPTNHLSIDQLDLGDSSVIVDVGCGTGSALRYGSTKLSGGQLIGIDPVPRMLEIAIEQTKDHPAQDRIEFRLGPAESLPVEDNVADWVLAFDSIDHWTDVTEGLAEVKRILRPGGSFAIVKDSGTPKPQDSINAAASKLKATGFTIDEPLKVSDDEIEFFLLIAQVPPQEVA